MTTTTEVKRVVRAYLNDHENPSVAEFVATHVDFIKQNTPSGKLANKVWPNIIRDEAARLRKILTKNRVSWKVLCASTSDNHNSATSNNIEIDRPALTSTPSHNNAVTTSSSPAPNSITPPSINSAASSSSLGKRSRSSSAKTDSYELTPDMKEEYKRAFEALDDNKKWVLDDGTKVEDAMYAYGANCTHEHPVHSFILDTEDKCWKSVFNPSQLQQLKLASNKPFCEYDEACKNMFSVFSEVIKDAKSRKLASIASSSSTSSAAATTAATDLTIKDEEDLIDELWERLAEIGPINPRKHYDLYWLQKTMDHFLNLYRFKVLEWVKNHGSEMDFINRVWTILDQVFDDIRVETRRDNGSVSATFIDNEDRAVTGMAAIAAKVSSIRPDLVLFQNGVEYGVAECGKGDDEEVGKKEIVETSLHCPKIMKSMFLHAASKCDNDEGVTRALQIVGFCHFDLRMKVLVMDNANGYVCRIRSTPQYEISTIPSQMSSGLLPILKLTLRSKLTIQSSIKVVNDYSTREEDNEPDFQASMDQNKTRLVLPRLQKSPIKKPKKSV